MAKRQRRTFTKEFKADAVRLVREGGHGMSKVARELDLTETALREWVKRAEIDAGQSPTDALTTAERVELSQLRRDVKRLEMEREILKKATVGSTGRCNTATDSRLLNSEEYAASEERIGCGRES